MGDGNSQVSKQTTSSGPWPKAAPYIEGAMGKAQKMLDNRKGFKAFPGQGWVDFSPETNQALGSISAKASNPNPFYGGASNFTQGLIGGNYNLDQSGYQGLMGQGPNTEGAYQNMFNDVNSSFNSALDTQIGKLGDDISRQFTGASFGSAAHTGTLADQLGAVRTQAMADNFYNNQNLRRGLLGDITGVQQQNFDNTRGLLGDMSQLSQQDINNRMGGLSMADSVYASQYLPDQMLAGVGAAKEAKAGEELQAKMDAFNIKNMAPWDRLAQAYGIFSGSGAQGSRSTTSVSQPTDIWSKLLGGGLLASQVF